MERLDEGAGDAERYDWTSEGTEIGLENSSIGESGVRDVDRASVRSSWMEVYSQR